AASVAVSAPSALLLLLSGLPPALPRPPMTIAAIAAAGNCVRAVHGGPRCLHRGPSYVLIFRALLAEPLDRPLYQRGHVQPPRRLSLSRLAASRAHGRAAQGGGDGAARN